MTTEKIIRNSAKCLLCGDEIESHHRHHFNVCECGNLAVDGGREYLRRAVKTDGTWIETSIVEGGEDDE